MNVRGKELESSTKCDKEVSLDRVPQMTQLNTTPGPNGFTNPPTSLIENYINKSYTYKLYGKAKLLSLTYSK